MKESERQRLVSFFEVLIKIDKKENVRGERKKGQVEGADDRGVQNIKNTKETP